MTAIERKYAQVSAGCWQSPTAVQVGLRRGCRPDELQFCSKEVVLGPLSSCCPAVCLYSGQQGSGKHMHEVEPQFKRMAQRFSAQRAANGRGRALDAFYLTHVICSQAPCGHVLQIYVCLPQTGLLPRPCHSSSFVLFQAVRQWPDMLSGILFCKQYIHLKS